MKIDEYQSRLDEYQSRLDEYQSRLDNIKKRIDDNDYFQHNRQDWWNSHVNNEFYCSARSRTLRCFINYGLCRGIDLNRKTCYTFYLFDQVSKLTIDNYNLARVNEMIVEDNKELRQKLMKYKEEDKKKEVIKKDLQLLLERSKQNIDRLEQIDPVKYNKNMDI